MRITLKNNPEIDCIETKAAHKEARQTYIHTRELNVIGESTDHKYPRVSQEGFGRNTAPNTNKVK